MSIEHNPNPLTDEEWERICDLGGSWSNMDRSRLDCYRAAGITVEPPPALPYRIRSGSNGGWVPVIQSNTKKIVAEFLSEDDARTWTSVLNGSAKIVWGLA